jgi:hypothetical protein
MLRRQFERRKPGLMNKVPESRRAEVEHRPRKIDRGMIVQKPTGYGVKQGLCDGQFTSGGSAMQENEFHLRTFESCERRRRSKFVQ